MIKQLLWAAIILASASFGAGFLVASNALQMEKARVQTEAAGESSSAHCSTSTSQTAEMLTQNPVKDNLNSGNSCGLTPAEAATPIADAQRNDPGNRVSQISPQDYAQLRSLDLRQETSAFQVRPPGLRSIRIEVDAADVFGRDRTPDFLESAPAP